MNVFELFAKLGIDTTEYDKGLDASEKKGASFGKGLKTAAGIATTAIAATTAAVGAGAKAFVSGASSVAQYGDNIDKTSQKLGLSAKSFQEWDYVMNISGTSMNNMTMGLKTLTNQVDAAKSGSKDAQAKFAALGISLKDLSTMSREDVFAATIAGFQGMAESTERAALANDLFGRSGQELTPLFNTTAEETQKLIQTANEYGMIMSDDAVKSSAGFQDSLTTMQNTMEGMKNNMLGSFLPAFSTTMDGLSKIFSGTDVDGGLQMIETGVKDLANGLVSKAPQLMQIGGSILTALVSSISSNLPVLLNAAVPVILELANGIIAAAPDIITAVISVLGTIGTALADPENLSNVINSAMAIVMTISDAIAQNAPTVIPAIVEVIMQMLTTLTDESVLMPLLSAGLSVITSVVQGILKAIPVLIKNLPVIISNIQNFLINSMPLILSAAIQLFGGIIAAIPQIIVELVKQLPFIITSIVSGLLEGTKQIVSVGGQLLTGLWQGISDKVGWIIGKIKGFGSSVISAIKGIFGIHSPSRIFRDEVGEMLALGLGEGFEKGLPDVEKGMINSTKDMTDEISDAMQVNSSVAMDGYTMRATGGISTSQATGDISALVTAIQEGLKTLQLFAPIYISGSKVDQQIVTATARNNVISGGR